MRKIAIIVAAAGVVALTALVPAASAGSHASAAARADRNHDRIPDRWEKRHHLSLKVKQTHRDQDRDGLDNLGEFRAGTNPRDADTDNDGIKDGREVRDGLNPRDRDSDDDGVADDDEGAGTVQSFTPGATPGTGTLVISLAAGGTLSGQVTSATEVECESATPVAGASRDGSDDSSGDDRSGSNSGPGSGTVTSSDDNSGPGSTSSGSGEVGDDDGGDRDENERACSTADLTPGTPVHEAELGADGAFREVELVK